MAHAQMPDPAGYANESAALVREALDAADELDARRIDVAVRDDQTLVLTGWVFSDEQRTLATVIADEVSGSSAPVVDELQIDQNLREGTDDRADVETVRPAENEVLVGSTDMLAGPDAAPTYDLGRAIDESEPWSPPDRPIVSGTHEVRYTQTERADQAEAVVAEPAPDDQPAAADLNAADLRRAPSLDPERPQPPAEATADDPGVDGLGKAPDDETLDPMVEQVPGTARGPGATGEWMDDPSIGATPATETGAKGVDEGPADPARRAGGQFEGAGTHRGPQAREDEALREDLSSED